MNIRPTVCEKANNTTNSTNKSEIKESLINIIILVFFILVINKPWFNIILTKLKYDSCYII